MSEEEVKKKRREDAKAMIREVVTEVLDERDAKAREAAEKAEQERKKKSEESETLFEF